MNELTLTATGKKIHLSANGTKTLCGRRVAGTTDGFTSETACKLCARRGTFQTETFADEVLKAASRPESRIVNGQGSLTRMAFINRTWTAGFAGRMTLDAFKARLDAEDQAGRIRLLRGNIMEAELIADRNESRLQDGRSIIVLQGLA